MRRPYATWSDHYPTLDAALRRIGDLEEDNRALQYELDHPPAAPPSSSGVVSAAVVENVLNAFAAYETESIRLEARVRETRETFARALSALFGHSRGRDRDVLSSAIIPTGERDWRHSPADVSRLLLFYYYYFTVQNIEMDAELVQL